MGEVGGALRGVKVVVAEDTQARREDLTRRLEELGLEVTRALEVSALRAWGLERGSAAAADVPELLLISIGLDGAPLGIEAAAELRELLGIPVVFLVSGTNLRQLQRAQSVDPFAFVFEPFEDVALVAALNAALRRRELEAQLKESERRNSVALAGHRRSEEELRSSEERYRCLFEDMDEGVALNEVLFDENGEANDYVILAANPAFERHSPYTIAHALGRRATDIYQMSPEFIRQWYLQHAPRKQATHTEMWHEPTRRWLHIVTTPISSGRFGTFFTDITQQKRVEAALREGEQRFRAIFDQTFQFVGLLSTDGTLVEANRSSLEVAGILPQDVIGKPFWEGPWWAHSEDLRRQLRDAVRTAAAGQFVRFEATHPGVDGKLHTVDFSLKPVRDDEGRVVMLIPEGRDISERIQAEEALRELEVERRDLEARVAQKQKLEAIGQLAAGIAHDFNNLLTVMCGCTDLLLTDEVLAPSVRDMVEEIQAAATRAALLVTQLLAFSRKQVLKPRVIDLGHLVAEMVRLLERLLGEDISLSTVAEPELWPIEIDPGQLEQVIVNLAVNGRDAMPRGGTLSIEMSNIEVANDSNIRSFGVTPGRYVSMSVRDTGVGMQADVLEHVFDPFFTTKDVGKGTGLGLATVYGIVQQSSGFIYAQSEVEGGACFRILFPRADPATRTSLRRSSFVPASAEIRGGETILLVEDDAAVRAISAAGLRAYGYVVLEANSGEDALARFLGQADVFQLIVTDVVMSRMSGREVAERFVATKPSLRVLYASGYPDDAILQHGISLGGVAFLQKPYTSRALAQQVRYVLDAQAGPEASKRPK